MSTTNHIAIIGMSGSFPGAKDISALWQLLTKGQEGLRRLSHAEMRAAGVTEEELNHHDYVPVAGTLEDIDFFAADFFGYSPREASQLDPQQRLLLEHAWYALEDAAIDPYRYPGAIGVFVGSSLNTYLLNNILNNPAQCNAEDLQQILFGNGADYLATRIAYLLNLKGAALNIQTACSTSLVAVHDACQFLLSHQVDVALAGGVSVAVPQTKGYRYQVDGMLSKDGQCKPFSSNASGTVFSSGLGIVVLKRLQDALDDNDPIYAIIKGSAINNDGRQKVGYTAPSVEGQGEVIALAQGIAEVSSEQISYIETHGTATALGDLIELSALNQVFGQQVAPFCALGSLKSNLGHLDVAAGIAGLIKTVLSLQGKEIPPTLHAAELNRSFAWQGSALYVNNTLQPWTKQQGQQRHAGVSSFGIGGTNAHVILAEYEAKHAESQDEVPTLLIFSTKTTSELTRLLEAHAQYARVHPGISLHGMARTLQEGRSEFNVRTAVIVQHVTDFIQWVEAKQYIAHRCEQRLARVTPEKSAYADAKALQVIMTQWLAGHVIEWGELYHECKPIKLHLPPYPLTKTRHWIEPVQNLPTESDQPQLAMDDWFYVPSWKRSLLADPQLQSTNNRILMFVTDEIMQDLDDYFFNFVTSKSIFLVFPGQDMACLHEQQWTINPNCPEHFTRLVKSLQEHGGLPTHVVHAWSLNKTVQPVNRPSFEAAQALGLLSIVQFIQAWDHCTEQQPVKLTIVINHLNRIAGENVTQPHKAPLLAAVKVIPKELLTIETQLVDIDAFDVPVHAAFQWQQVAKEICKAKYSDEEIVYRGVGRWLRDYVRTPIQTQLPHYLDRDKVIVITGGLGQLGLDIAEYFAQHYACRIALLARTKIPSEQQWDEALASLDADHPFAMLLQRIQLMRAMGATVIAYAADVEDKQQLHEAFQAIESELGKISGVIHAAGETINGIITLKTPQSLHDSYAAKVYGTYHLWEVIQQRNLDFCILCSSMNSIIGGLGQLDNTAANAFIDYMSEYMVHTTGQNIFAINWGAINVNRPMKVNVLHQFMDLSTEHKKNRMTDEEVNEIYHRLISVRPSPRIVISTIDMQHVWKRWNEVASLESLGKDREVQSDCNIRHISVDERPTTTMEQWIKDRWSQLLGIEQMSIDDNFFGLGGHSLAAVQFITKVREVFNINTHVMNLYEMPTIKAFSKFLESKHSRRETV